MIFVCGDSNQSVHLVPEIGLQNNFWKLCELRREVLFPKDRNVSSDNTLYIGIERSMTVLNQESMVDGVRFSENFAHKILETAWLQGIWHCLHEWRDEVEMIPNVIQELITEYVWYSVLH
jgi:hypothetical protein